MALAVILDMDGLMLDTEPISLRAWRQVSRELGHELNDGICDRMIGLNLVASKELLIRHFGDSFPADELGRLATARYQEYLEAGGVPHKPGLVEFIRFLDERNIARAVATSTATELATYKLRQAGVLHHFEIVVGGDQVSRGKPEPDVFLMAASRLGHRPIDCVVLEDSEPGILAAVAAGMKPILIPDGREPSPATRRAAHVVESLFIARTVIEQMINEAT